ncbi:MAG TPA: YggT family protein [Roseiflexaceae bacterium]|nr:YggT family protein [Roseiflexaceae bacterium]
MRHIGIVWYLLGGLWGLLAARLLLRLLAARPSNPAVELLYSLTGPLVAPLTALDARQPRFGAVLELSTLALLGLLALLMLAARLASRRARPAA